MPLLIDMLTKYLGLRIAPRRRSRCVPTRIQSTDPHEIRTLQITAEQLLREVFITTRRDIHILNLLQAQERQDGTYKAPRQRVEDFEELNEYRGRKRREFEEKIRRTRGNVCLNTSFYFPRY
jgi:hypothetical protein